MKPEYVNWLTDEDKDEILVILKDRPGLSARDLMTFFDAPGITIEFTHPMNSYLYTLCTKGVLYCRRAQNGNAVFFLNDPRPT